MLEYHLSFVQDYPTSALATFQFSLAAIFVTGFVFVVGTISYWALSLVALRGRNVLTAAELLPEGSEIDLRTSDVKEDDVLSFVSDIIISAPEKLPLQNDTSQTVLADAMEILAIATDIAQAQSHAAKEYLRVVKEGLNVRVGPWNENTKSEFECLTKQREEHARNLHAEVESAIKGNKDQDKHTHIPDKTRPLCSLRENPSGSG